MIFLYPNFLLFMVLPLIVFSYFIVTNKKKIDIVFDKKILEKLVIRRNSLGLTGQNILLFASLFLFIVALSRPVLPKQSIELKTKKESFAILLDISSSMLAKDIYPNRLEFAKKKIISLLKHSSANISIYAFSDKLYQISPQSDDRQIQLTLLKHLNINQKLNNSSNLYDAIKHIKEQSILIFSDGSDMKDFSKIKSLDKDIVVYLTATKRGKPIYHDGSLVKDKNNNIVITRANTAIKDIGRVIRFSTKEDLNNFRFYTSNSVGFTLKEYDELFIYFLGLASFLLIFVFYSPKNIKLFIFISLIYMPNVNIYAFEIDYLILKKATTAYKNREYKKALKLFEPLASHNKSPELLYNLSNCYYKVGSYKKAIKTYMKVLTKDKELNYKVYFNLANSYFKLKEYKRAYEFYKLAQNIKTTPKLKTNLFLVSKYFQPKSQTPIMIGDNKIDKTTKIKLKTFMIPLTKGKSSDISW